MARIYSKLIADHFANNRQMVFLSGPRQVGKTTLAHDALPGAAYFNYDRTQDVMLVECKTSPEEPLSSALVEFKKSLSAPYAFQIAIEAPPIDFVPMQFEGEVIKLAALDLLKVLV